MWLETILRQHVGRPPAICMQGYLDSVFDAAEAIPEEANKALLIFDDLVTILNVDVNVTGMNNDAAVGAPALHT